MMIDLQKASRAALLALILGATTLTGLPAQAQGLGFSFGFGIDDDDEDDFFPRRLCILSDRGLRDAIRDEGYSNIFLNASIGRYVQARASRGNWVYLLRVNICTGEIVDRERLRRR
jgi:hypothetical protein